MRLTTHSGPAETHVATVFALPDDVSDWPERPPIGGPIANMRAWLLYTSDAADEEDSVDLGGRRTPKEHSES